MRIKFLCLALLLPGIVSGAVLEVFPGDWIQAAVNAAWNYDTVLVHEGLYVESVVLYGKSLTIASEFLLDGDSTHILQTAIQSHTVRPDTHSCFVYAYDEPPTGRLVGFSIFGNSGGTHLSIAPADMGFGGGIYIFQANVSIEHCRFEGCEAHRGGAIFARGAHNDFSVSQVNIRGCLFYDCEAWIYPNGSWSAAGAIYADECTMNISNTIFDSDSVLGFGGALLGYGVIHVDSCIIRNCYALIAGGIELDTEGGRIRDCIFDSNNSFQEYEGHLVLAGEDELVTRCVFRNCVGEGASITSLGERTRFIGNVVEDNVTNYMVGIYQNGSSGFGEIAYNVFRRNRSAGGGMLYCFQDAQDRIHHNVFEENSADSVDRGSAIRIRSSHPTLDSNLIVGHDGVAVRAENLSPNYPVIHAENNWWGHESGPFHPTLNPVGQGDTLNGEENVLFIPWLTAPPDTTMPNAVPDPAQTVAPVTWQLMELYPNPFNADLTIQLAGFTNHDFEISLHNVLGQQVGVIHRGALTGGAITYRAPGTLSSGVYFVVAADEIDVQSTKVILLK